MFSEWTQPLELPDEILDSIQWYRRILDAGACRSKILKHSVFVQKEQENNIFKTPTRSGVPFHNNFPFEKFDVDGRVVKVGMWCDRDDEIYIMDGDGLFDLSQSRIQCKRIYFQKKWYDMSRLYDLPDVESCVVSIS